MKAGGFSFLKVVGFSLFKAVGLSFEKELGEKKHRREAFILSKFDYLFGLRKYILWCTLRKLILYYFTLVVFVPFFDVLLDI